MRLIKATLLLLVCFAAVLEAQVTTADIVGRVTDATGAVVPAAKVTATNTATNIIRTADTNDAGDYVFNLLSPGQYSVKVEKQGFKVFNLGALTLSAGDRSRVDASMAVGQTSETVEVTAQAALLQTDSSSLGTSVSGKLVQDLPLNGRNYISLAQLAPGVGPGPANGLATGGRPDDRRLNSSFSVNGQDPVANNNMIDGMDNNERVIGTIGVRPSIDAIAEFKVQTNLYSAEVTRTSAGVVNILTKSGTNAFHGTLFEFLRNDKLDGNGNYNLTGGTQLPRSPFRQNQYGGSLGGPIKKDKTFFFGDYEGLKIRQGLLVTAQVPTAKQRVGDFSEVPNINVVNSVGGVPVGAVPGGRLDQGAYRNLLDPLALKIAQLYPLPTSSVVNGVNYASSPTRPQDSTTFDGRVDHSFSPAWNFFSRYSFNDVTTLQPTGFPDVGNINPAGRFTSSDFSGSNKTRAQQLQLNLVHIFSPTLLLELKAGYTRAAIQSRTINDFKSSANEIGFPCNAISCVNIGDDQTYGLPRLIMNSGFQELGDAVFVPLLQFDNTFQYAGAVTWTRGSHNVKFGASLIRRQFSLVQSASSRGQFTFNPSSTNAPVPLNNGFANFLLGAPSTIARNAALFKPGWRAWEPGFYVQDDWRVNRRLTLNLGVRYDIFTAKVEQYNRMANFDPALGIILIAGQNSSRSAGVQTDHSNFAPRIGFAYSAPAGIVLRGGFGLSFFPTDYTSGVALKNPPVAGAFACGPSTVPQTAGSPIATGCPAGIGTLSQGAPRPLQVTDFATTQGPGGTTLDLARIPSSSLGAVDLNYKSGLNMQYNIMAEKQFGSNVVSVGYVGMSGRRLAMAMTDINRQAPTGTAISAPRPFATTAPRISSIGFRASQGDLQFHSLQIGFNRRLARGLSFTSGLTFQNGTDNVTGQGTSTGGYSNFGAPTVAATIAKIKEYDQATSDFNVKRRLSFGGNYELPGKSLKGFAGQILGGWQSNGSITWMTGLPFTITDATSTSGVTGLTTERPDQILDSIYTADRSIGAQGRYVNPAAFALPPTSASGSTRLGNSPRNLGEGPNQAVVNFSMFKTFKFGERTSLQFRAESFNIANHPFFGNPNTTFGNANFGTITQMAGGYTPRQIQFALKLLF